MWEEGAHIYGTPGVHNNFPLKTVQTKRIKDDGLKQWIKIE